MAAEEVKQEIERIQPTEGKMFGVLVVEGGFLAAYSGLLEGRNDWDYFVPPVYDAQQPDGYFKTREREIMASVDHKEMSQELQLWLFRQYRMLNARGEEKDLVEIWQDYHTSPRIREKYPLPPGGTGDCCAPKLLQYAYQHGLKPVCMAEFWWGASPKGLVRHHGQFYPACSGKCKPVLTWMLQGLAVDPDPEVQGLRHQEPRIVWEDEVMAVVDKPSGMLSMPGKIGAYHHLQKQFEERTIKKKYLAIVEGEPRQEHGVIDLPLSSDPLNRPFQIVDHTHGKRAITEYRVLQTVGDGSFLFDSKETDYGQTKKNRPQLFEVALWPHTGRTHQLRVHCAHEEGLGCPILGDELYGRKADRLYLQAQAISFVHPTTGKRMHFELPNILSYG